MIGLSASDAGLQFSLRYALVDSSANEKEEKENFHMQKLIIKVNRHIGVKKKHFTDDDWYFFIYSLLLIVVLIDLLARVVGED